MRTTIEGPKLRWISRTETVKVPIPPPLITPHATTGISSSALSSYRSVYGSPGTLFTPTNYTYASGSLVKTSVTPASATPSQAPPSVTLSHFSPYQYQTSPFPVWPPTHQQPYYPIISTTTPSTSIPPSSSEPENQLAATSIMPAASLSTQPNPLPTDPQPAISEPEYRSEPATKNYLVHELAQHRGAPRPTWGDNMKAMFGDHVKWEDLKVFVGKNRPHCK